MIWEAADRICGKRLNAAIPNLVESMEGHGHLALDPEVRDRLLAADDYTHMRHVRIKLPKARRTESQQSPEPACRDPGCTCCGRWRDVA